MRKTKTETKTETETKRERQRQRERETETKRERQRQRERGSRPHLVARELGGGVGRRPLAVAGLGAVRDRGVHVGELEPVVEHLRAPSKLQLI